MISASQLPNIITIARMACVVPLVWLLMVKAYGSALVLAMIAGLTDAIDGFLARHYGWRSELGGILDPLADKFLLAAGFVVLTAQGELPLWLLAIVLVRDLVIVIGGVCYHYVIEPVQTSPTLVSKLNTCTQIALVLVVLLALSFWPEAEAWRMPMVMLVAATSLYSGAEYICVWGLKAWRRGSAETASK